MVVARAQRKGGGDLPWLVAATPIILVSGKGSFMSSRRGKAVSAAGKTTPPPAALSQPLSVLQVLRDVAAGPCRAEMPARQFVKFCRSSARSCNLANAARSPACAAAAATPDMAATAAPDAAATAATAATNIG